MSKQKTYPLALLFVSLALLWCNDAHPTGPGSSIVVQDIGLINMDGFSTIRDYHDNTRIYFRIANCGTETIKNIWVEVEALNTTKKHPSSPTARRIRSLEPGHYEDVLCKVDAFSSGPELELLLIVHDDSRIHAGYFTFFGNTEYQHADDMSDSCEAPVKTLEVFYDLSKKEILAIGPGIGKDEETIILQNAAVSEMPDRRASRTPSPPHRTAKRLYALGALTSLGTGTYFLLEANSLFNNDYKEATHDAPDIRNKIERYDMIWQAAFALSAPLIVMAGIKAVRQNRAGNSFHLGAAPTGGGAVVGMRFDF